MLELAGSAAWLVVRGLVPWASPAMAKAAAALAAFAMVGVWCYGHGVSGAGAALRAEKERAALVVSRERQAARDAVSEATAEALDARRRILEANEAQRAADERALAAMAAAEEAERNAGINSGDSAVLWRDGDKWLCGRRAAGGGGSGGRCR